MIEDDLTNSILHSAIEVHRELGPGLLESTYRICLCHEFELKGIPFVKEPTLDMSCKDLTIANGYRADLVVANQVIIELKHVEKLLAVHEAQLRTYLKLSKFRTGLLLNFNSTALKNGIRRLSNPDLSHFSKPPTSPSPP